MNNNVKKWIDALRSGEYKQAYGTLEEDGKFCCLGVACDLAIKDGLPVKRSLIDNTAAYDGETGVLPRAVVEWLGLNNYEGSFRDEEYDSLIAVNDAPDPNNPANDGGGANDFNVIADLIESEPEGLFAK